MAAPDPPKLPGIHHVSAICGDPQRNVDFYAGLLGMRLVKRTVNFDDPGSYHLYYGDGEGTPGTLLTFFAWTRLPPMSVAHGRPGAGQIGTVALAVPAGSADFWVDRLAAAAVDFEGPEQRFGETVVSLTDPDGLRVELVAGGGGPAAPWVGAGVPAEHAVRGVHGVSLCLSGFERSASMLTGVLGMAREGEEGSRFRFRAGDGSRSAAVDLLVQPDARPGRMGIGSVHHVAFRAPSPEVEERWRTILAAEGHDVTPVLDRQYFRSIYFREPGGVILEIATDGPGFTVDEKPEALGTALMLPPWLEARRARIETGLPEIRPPRTPAGASW
jgi:glyoxalase family protein